MLPMEADYEETENLNRPIMTREIESVIITSQQRKGPNQMALLMNSTKYLKKN